MKNPPSGVKLVMAAVCVMKDIKPDRISDPAGTGKKVSLLRRFFFHFCLYWNLVFCVVVVQVFDYWGPSKKLLGDMNFLRDLKEYDKDNISVSG